MLGKMSSPTTADMADAVSRSAERFVRLVRSAPDPDLPIPATPGWSLTDVVGHLAMEPPRYEDLARGGDDWLRTAAELPAYNARQLRELPTRDLHELTALLRRGVDSLLATVLEFGADQPDMRFDGGTKLPADRALGTLIAEYLVHGWDIATAMGRRWPIDAADVSRVMEALVHIAPGWVDPDDTHTANYELRLRGQRRYYFEFRSGALTVTTTPPDRVDLRISADPESFLLVNYGRRSPVRESLSWRIVAWGRKPWLATAFNRRFLNP
ncbi:uncharacterized protein (TIGR03083 family) [Saccharopolyspora erythraea NRRL 2338]|nr:uncharacterized protein (TIGR03083 family) [Saccharopolyspora erythraea NRRL 2338]QRK91089.1 maleylpyruvate isomerase family mycothiol-dependent enzyme [Saccharopolyspora erythraea]